MSEYVDAPYQRQFHAEFREKEVWRNRIDRNKKDSIFPNSIRIRIISYLLKQAMYGEKSNDKGVDRFIIIIMKFSLSNF